MMRYPIPLLHVDDGRWIPGVSELPGALVYGPTSEPALAKVKALTLRVIADRLDHGETASDLDGVSFAAA